MNLIKRKSRFLSHCNTVQESHQQKLQQLTICSPSEACFNNFAVFKAATSSFLAMNHEFWLAKTTLDLPKTNDTAGTPFTNLLKQMTKENATFEASLNPCNWYLTSSLGLLNPAFKKYHLGNEKSFNISDEISHTFHSFTTPSGTSASQSSFSTAHLCKIKRLLRKNREPNPKGSKFCPS